ncbi:hypothetical protein V6N13_008154 [Hibiscus sabdariffa]
MVKFKKPTSMVRVGRFRFEVGDDFGVEVVKLGITDVACCETMFPSDIVNKISGFVSLEGEETKVGALVSFPIELSFFCFSLQASNLGLKIVHEWPSEFWGIMSLKISYTTIPLLFVPFHYMKWPSNIVGSTIKLTLDVFWIVLYICVIMPTILMGPNILNSLDGYLS